MTSQVTGLKNKRVMGYRGTSNQFDGKRQTGEGLVRKARHIGPNKILLFEVEKKFTPYHGIENKLVYERRSGVSL